MMLLEHRRRWSLHTTEPTFAGNLLLCSSMHAKLEPLVTCLISTLSLCAPDHHLARSATADTSITHFQWTQHTAGDEQPGNTASGPAASADDA